MLRHVMISALVIISCAASVRADDTEIYGTVTNPTLEPNVLIIFDTSGSMATEDVPGEPYDEDENYPGSYDSNGVYQRTWSWSYYSWVWNLITGDVNNIQCDTIKDALKSAGYATGYLRGTPDFTCGGTTEKRLRLGNYMNYVVSGVGTSRSRISVAKDVLTDLINTTTGVRFGMMVFNYEQGGRLVRLHVWENNPAVGFYRRNGYRIMATDGHKHLMEKQPN